jgi:L-ribulose-5-phosphate 3-epimerase
MIKSISYWSFPQMSIEEILRTAKQLGYQAVELTLEAEGEICPSSSPDDIKRIKDLAESIGIQTPTLATGLGWAHPAVGPTDAAGAQGLEIVKKELEFAEILGASTVLVVPCTVGPDFEYDMAYDRTVEVFSGPIADEAASRGVCIGLEYVWNKFLLSPLEFRRIIDEINRPYVQAYFDVGNVLIAGFPEQWIRILGERIKAVHFKDFKLAIGNITGFIDLLEGDVAWDRVMAALKAIGYQGAVTAEMMPPYGYFPLKLVEHTSSAMDAILAL